MGIVILNGKDYEIKGEVRRFSLEPFAQAFRPIGLQRREGIVTASSFVFPPPTGGFGLARLRDIDDPKQALRFWDSTLETRFGSQVTLAPLNQDASEHASSNVMKTGVEHKGTLYGIFTELSATPEHFIGAYHWAAAGTFNWGDTRNGISGGQVNPAVPLDVITHKTSKFLLWALTNDHKISSAAANTWAAAEGTGWPANLLADSVTRNEDIDAGLLLDFGNTLLAFLWDENNGEIKVWKSTDSGTNWTSVVTVGSSNGPTGVAVFFDQNGDIAPVVGTREGIYAIDLTNSTASRILSLADQPSNDNCRRMAVWNGDLYVPLGDGGTLRVRHHGSGQFSVTPVGPNLDDGLPSERQGHVTWMLPTSQWLFVAYGGHTASTKASIFAYDGLGWHHIFQNGTANQEIDWIGISDRDDGTLRMHISVRTGTNSTDMRFLEKPLTNPKSESVRCESSGSLTRPEFDGGMPKVDTAWLEVFYDAADLSASTAGEYINIDYGLDGDDPATDLGDILSGDKDLQFASGVGVSGNSISVKETYNRDSGDNTQTPKGRSLEVTYLKQPVDLFGFGFEVDIVSSARHVNGGVEEVIANLTTAQASVTLVTLKYGKASQVNVRVRAIEGLEQLTEPANAFDEGERHGTVKVLCEQVI